MPVEPYRSARTVYWVLDNDSGHAGQTSVKRIATAYPNARLIHLPVGHLEMTCRPTRPTRSAAPGMRNPTTVRDRCDLDV